MSSSILTTDLSHHLALVTGATGGIGKATCLALAELGCSIAVHYNAASEKAKILVEELRGKGIKAEAFQADLSSYDNVGYVPIELSSTLRSHYVTYIPIFSICGENLDYFLTF